MSTLEQFVIAQYGADLMATTRTTPDLDYPAIVAGMEADRVAREFAQEIAESISLDHETVKALYDALAR